MYGLVASRAADTYRSHFREIIAIAAVVLIPAAVLAGGLRQLVADAAWDGLTADLVTAAVTVGLGGIGYFFLAAVITDLVAAHRHGRPRRRIRALALSIPYMTLIVVDLFVTGAITAGLELFVIPGLIVASRFALAPIVIELEHCGARESLRRSINLSKGDSLAVLGILVLTLGVTSLLAIPLKDLFKEVLPAAPAEMLGLLLAGILVKPIGAVAEVELVLELSERHSGD